MYARSTSSTSTVNSTMATVGISWLKVDVERKVQVSGLSSTIAPGPASTPSATGIQGESGPAGAAVPPSGSGLPGRFGPSVFGPELEGLGAELEGPFGNTPPSGTPGQLAHTSEINSG